MRDTPGFLICLIIITGVIISGCVAPPKEVSTSVMTTAPTTVIASTPTPGSAYVAEVTPFVTFYPSATETEKPGYHVFTDPTPLPEEQSCRIYTTTRAFMYNGTAFSFDLKNPPMYINYSVHPTNISGYGAYTSRYTTKKDIVEKFDIFDPQSYLEITVRNKESGEIYLQDGFGKDYSMYTNRTLKVLNADDMLIEIKGNKINGTINFWVKPSSNIDNPENMTCTYWSTVPRDSLPYINSTPTPVWTH